MRRKSTFTIYTREMKDGSSVFYASFYDRTGTRVQRSTGIEDNGTKSAGVRAENAAIEWLGQEKADTITGEPAAVLLRDFAAHFYDLEGQWMKRQRAKGRKIGTVWAKERRRHVEGYILPAFGSKPLSEITRPAVERWLVDLALANGTKNAILYGFRTIMEEAEAERHISRNPLEKVEPMGAQAPVTFWTPLNCGSYSRPRMQSALQSGSRIAKTECLPGSASPSCLHLHRPGSASERHGRYSGGTFSPGDGYTLNGLSRLLEKSGRRRAGKSASSHWCLEHRWSSRPGDGRAYSRLTMI